MNHRIDEATNQAVRICLYCGADLGAVGPKGGRPRSRCRPPCPEWREWRRDRDRVGYRPRGRNRETPEERRIREARDLERRVAGSIENANHYLRRQRGRVLV